MGTDGRGDGEAEGRTDTGRQAGAERRGCGDKQTQSRGQTDTGMDGQPDGWTDGRTDGQTDGQTAVRPRVPQVRQVRLFQDEQIYSDLYLTVCEWPSDSSKLIVFGFK